jgi:hypothetical protein
MLGSRARIVRVLGAIGLCALAVAGCGRKHETRERVLTFEELEKQRDTTGLSRGGAIVRRFEPYRMENGAVRVRGELGLPDGTVLQIAVFRPGERWPFTKVQSEVVRGRFDTSPIIGANGPLPDGTYHFELTVFFESSLQPSSVMRKTGDGRELRGPGVTRDRNGIPAFSHAEDRRL